MIFTIIYVLVCVLIGYVCSFSNIHVNDWRYWIFLLGASISYICGVMTNDVEHKKRNKKK